MGAYSIGFDIGGTNIKAGIMDENLSVVSKNSVSFPHENASAVARLMTAMATGLIDNIGADPAQVSTVGVAIPGSIDPAGATVIDAYNIGFHDVGFLEILKRELPFSPAYIQMLNDADAAVQAEHRLGALKGFSNALLLTIGTGLGGGLIINDRLFKGGRGSGVELGHMLINLGGDMCSCGMRGCAETLCSASWLTERAKELFIKGNRAICRAADQKLANADAKALICCAEANDEDSLAVWNEFLDNLSGVIASLVNILDPEAIAIGGGVGGAGRFLIDSLNELTPPKCFYKSCGSIYMAKMGNDAGIVGSVVI